MATISGLGQICGFPAATCDDESLLAGVRRAYSAVADRPSDTHPFPVGRGFAEGVGYPAELLDSLPAVAVDAFAGVSNVACFADIAPTSTVLDIGCGAGLDTLVAAHRLGPRGRVLGVDFSPSMLAKARQAARRAGLLAERICHAAADAGRLPLRTASVDLVLVNGIFNLNPKRQLLFQEMARVLRPGGQVYGAEMIFVLPQEAKAVRGIDDWLA